MIGETPTKIGETFVGETFIGETPTKISDAPTKVGDAPTKVLINSEDKQSEGKIKINPSAKPT